MLQTLKKLLPAAPSVSGREQGICKILKDLMKPLCDEVNTDAMGNLICRKKGSAQTPRKVLLVAHMDEIGFIVNYIEENGYIRVAPIGGINAVAAANGEVTFENGVRGVIVPTRDAPEKEKLQCEHLVVDIGAADGKAAARRVKIGDCLALTPHVRALTAYRVSGRPLDDRIGCAVLVEIAAKLKNPADDVYFVFSVQEEVGCRGARTAAFAVEPDVALAFDVTGTGDEQGAKPMAVKLGAGVAVKVKDGSVICHQGLVDELLALAKEKKIPAQAEILLYGGTDTSAVQMTGVGTRAGALSIPCRYIHSGVETLDLRDAEAAVDLALAFLEGSTK